MRTAILLLALLATPALATEKTIPARTYDDVSGLPLVSKIVRRDAAAPTQWFMEACFVARTTGGAIIPLLVPCATCYGPDTNATEALCRAKVIANPDNGL